MPKVRVGFIGAGRIADLHALAYVNNPTGELYAVADPAPGRAEQRALQWGAKKSYADHREMLADPAVDAVEVLLPHHLHVDVTVAALEAGKHVSLQKPMALSVKEADRMIASAVWRAPERAAEWAGGLSDGAVVVYCVHGHEVSQGAAVALRSVGVDAVFLEGGIEGFIEAGGETVTK